ncbi:aspartate aminotransferase [Frondihabitans sp. PAMC 28766]|uniref:pyridoxal phosphate-dependent aminotransferase n=1 Tax=Frondihabitans sp. PAMC 28766 TaxID=1795630 RepID=UPI00078C6F51|nr:aminotransferase class I/II-fold pyridoxal phosphate-dependent enzyme [Frondihabitans sp. PAMC 28766]AMM21082.1 aspartate aminotransferase [Frondihabitans sp. PAMC 28766]
MPQLAPHIPSVPGSGIRRVFEIAMKLDDVAMLVVGEPDVPVAHHVIDAARRAWADDKTNYTPNGGITPLREALVAKLARENDVLVDLEQVWVTIGATQALHQCMGLLLAAGDDVLVPDPGYTTFTMNARMLDANPVPYSLKPSHDFLPDFDELAGLVTDKTRAIIVNSPSNPLGRVFDETVLRRLLSFAKQHDLWVISDEVYEYFTYDEKHVSLASLDDDDRVFSVFSLSKTYAMTGVRVGYLVTPKGMAETMRTVQEAQISCVAEPDQFAALAAVTGDNQPVADAREHYASNLRLARELLEARGIDYLDPRGAFYLWIDVSHAANGDVASWAEDFLLEKRVAVAPGSAFGRTGEGWIRICLAASPETLTRGISALPSPQAVPAA